MQSREEGHWWVDQHGREYPSYALWKLFNLPDGLVLHCWDETAGVYVCERRTTGELVHLVRIAPPDAATQVREGWEEWFYGDVEWPVM